MTGPNEGGARGELGATAAPRSLRPERLAAVARMLQPLLMDSVALQADRISDDLARILGLVTWERERRIGEVQRGLARLRDQRFGHPGGSAVRILERRRQPLECLVPVWQALRRGRSVHVEAEEGAIPQLWHLLHSMAALIGGEELTVARPGEATDPRYLDWRLVGVEPAAPRVGLVQADADPELAAYLLARTCLRWTGFDPRSIHHAVVAGRGEELERHLRRLWFGVTMAPVDDEQAFAGPVSADEAERFFAAERAWTAVAGCECLCPGARLEVAAGPADRAVFLAPALLRIAGGPNDGDARGEASLPPPVGPMLVLHACHDAGEAELTLERLVVGGGGRLRIGPASPARRLGAQDRQVEGALLVERLPPGLPDPRP